MMSFEKAKKIAEAINTGDGHNYGNFVTAQDVLTSHRVQLVGDSTGHEVYAFQFGDLTCIANYRGPEDIGVQFARW